MPKRKLPTLARHLAGCASSAVRDAKLVCPQQVPPNTITMNAQVMMADCETGIQNKLTSLYPRG